MEQRGEVAPLRFAQTGCVVDPASHAILKITQFIDALDREGRLVGLTSDSSDRERAQWPCRPVAGADGGDALASEEGDAGASGCAGGAVARVRFDPPVT